jgi:DNA-binding NtrC family response regulator
MKLLAIEDDKKIATAVARRLGAEGYIVDVALNGPHGLWIASEGSFDLIEHRVDPERCERPQLGEPSPMDQPRRVRTWGRRC